MYLKIYPYKSSAFSEACWFKILFYRNRQLFCSNLYEVRSYYLGNTAFFSSRVNGLIRHIPFRRKIDNTKRESKT